jgi:hypothetical protein
VKKESAKPLVPPPPPPKARKTTKVAPPPKKRNTPKKKKEKPPPPKLAYHMTEEELKETVRERVRAHFAPKKPPPVHQWSEVDKKYFRSLLQPKYRAPLSDYDRQITKSWEKPSNRLHNKVP